MTVVVIGIDALDLDLVDTSKHPNLALEAHREIDTITSTKDDVPSTHELWPTIITGLRPEEHGLQLEEGITWENPILNVGSTLAKGLLPDSARSTIGAWLLQNTEGAAFRTPTTYYEKNGLSTVFDQVNARTIGIPNYVVNPDEGDREHKLRKNMGDLFRHDPTRDGEHKHTSTDPREFYEVCLEMSMVRIARARRALRRREHELVFAYTSGLDLIGHVAYDDPRLQQRAYDELDEFVGELRNDLREEDKLVLISDHGLQDGIHTDTAMVSSTDRHIIEDIDSVLDFRSAIESELKTRDHEPSSSGKRRSTGQGEQSEEVREHLEDLGYM